MKFSPSQAHYALNVLLSQGKLRVAHIRKALKNREQEIRSLRERLAALEQFSPGASAARGPRRPGRPARAARKKRVRITSPDRAHADAVLALWTQTSS